MQTLQDIFNTAYLGLAKQGFEQSLRITKIDEEEEFPECAYRGDGGLRCAIGHVIPDERYTPALEGKSPESKEVQDALSLDISISPKVIHALQKCHDEAGDEEAMRGFLEDFARRNLLTIPQIDGAV